ncbi:MAG TPA: PQQ-dependent sugar dehydrogenase, partial [Pirellulales bacterium]
GILAALVGVGLWMASRKPQQHRGVVVLALASQSILALLITIRIAHGKLPTGMLPFILFGQVAFLPALALILRQLYWPEIAALLGRSANALLDPPHSGRARRLRKYAGWLLRFGWIPVAAAILLTTTLATARALDELQRHLFRPAPLVLSGIHTNLPPSLGANTPLTCENAFPNLRFVDPTFVTAMPDGSGRMAVIERAGRIVTFNSKWNAQAKTVLLDITDRTMQLPDGAEDGLFCVAFHPEFTKAGSPHRGEFFVHYTANVKGQRFNRLSKFHLPEGSETADAQSEVVLIDTVDMHQSHNGGSVLFGPDGFLYLTLGDDGYPQPNPHAQHIDGDLFSGILRLDVDCRGGEVSHPPPRQPNKGHTDHYYIPNDNPFVGLPNALEEFYAIGMRNPWRATFDWKTGTLWASDVGDRRREEINNIAKGSNCQWAYMEGTIPTLSFNPRATGKPDPYLGVETPPVWEYEHDALNRCVIGGYVYHGSQFPELAGKYVYADQSGRVYALMVDEQNHAVENKLIAVVDEPGLGISSFGEDSDGELYFCLIKELRQRSGEIQHLVRSEMAASQQLPAKLSETGLFADLKTLRPAAGFVPYEIIQPLWSDRAVKRRWIGLPAGEQISGELTGTWTYPAGTVFIKQFDLPLDEREPANSAKVRRLETRIVVRSERGGVYAATYRWNDEQTDATLVDQQSTEEIQYVDAHGETKTQKWLYPGRFECLACHNEQANYVLGFNVKQLNRDITVDRRVGNQMLRFSDAGLFATACTERMLNATPHLAALDDESATPQKRIRSYLDANCAQCHRPGHFFGAWDARFDTPIEAQGIVEGRSVMHHGEAADPQIVRPGDPANSFLLKRMVSTEPFMKMPPLARNVVDPKATALIEQWIRSLPSAKPVANPTQWADEN